MWKQTSWKRSYHEKADHSEPWSRAEINITESETMTNEQRPSLILTVDDEPDVLTLLREMLELKGEFRVVTAASGAEALQTLVDHAQDLPELILLDIMMDPMDGWETLMNIKKEDLFSHIPVIMLTAKPLTADLLQHGHQKIAYIENYITKPVNYLELSSKVKAVLDEEHTLTRALGKLKEQGRSEDAKKYEHYAKSIKRHRNLIEALRKSSQAGSSDKPMKIGNVMNAQRAMIKAMEHKLKLIKI